MPRSAQGADRRPDVGSTPNVDPSKLPFPYACIRCGASGVKLWRNYQVVACEAELLCRACAEAEQRRELKPPGDQIGWRVPAVPDTTGTFWGYTSVPDDGVRWWKELPETTGATP